MKVGVASPELESAALARHRLERRHDGGIGGPETFLQIGLDPAHRGGRKDGETVLQFTNAGWREAVPFIGHCSTKWATFFIGLKALLEGGRSNSYPDEIVISSWDH